MKYIKQSSPSTTDGADMNLERLSGIASEPTMGGHTARAKGSWSASPWLIPSPSALCLLPLWGCTNAFTPRCDARDDHQLLGSISSDVRVDSPTVQQRPPVQRHGDNAPKRAESHRDPDGVSGPRERPGVCSDWIPK